MSRHSSTSPFCTWYLFGLKIKHSPFFSICGNVNEVFVARRTWKHIFEGCWEMLSGGVWNLKKRVNENFVYKFSNFCYEISPICFINKLEIFLSSVDLPSRFHTRKFSLYQVAWWTWQFKGNLSSTLYGNRKRWNDEKISTNVFPRWFKITINPLNTPRDLP